MKDKVLITPLLFLQVVGEKTLDKPALIVLAIMAWVAGACAIVYMVFTLVDTAWGI